MMRDKDGFSDMLDKLDDSYQSTGQITEAFAAELAELRQSMVYTSREVGSLSSGIQSGLSRAFEGLILDGMKLSDALKGIGRSLADTAFGVAMKPVEQALAGSLASGINGLLSSALPFGGAAAGGFLQRNVLPFAAGGAVGQAEPPLAHMARGLLGGGGASAMSTRGHGSGGTGVQGGAQARPMNVSINVSTPDVAGFQRSRSQIAAEMGRVLARGQRNN